jgi:uncharacterized protein (TIGR02996 family)
MTEAEWITFLQRPEIAAFNQAMLANPDDDLPRLVFADWLDENCPDERVCKVVRESMSGRSVDMTCLAVPGEVRVTARRGRLHLTLGVNAPPRESAQWPIWDAGWVGGVRLYTTPPAEIRGWLLHPQMSGVEWLEVIDAGEHDAGVEIVTLVTTAHHMTAVRHLDLSMSSFGSDGARTLAACPHLTGLTTLKISDTEVGEAGARALAASPYLHKLRSLDLSSNPIGDAGLAALAASPLFARLDKLSVGTCGITVAGMRALAASPRFADPRPFELWLAGNQFGDGSPPDTEGLPKTLAAAIINGWEWSLDLR